MERVVQILDDIEDLFSMIGLARERIRALSILALVMSGAFLLQIAGILLALKHPGLALAMAVLMFTLLLYRAVTTPQPTRLPGS